MLLRPSEAEIGRDYLTAKSRIRVRFRGPAPRRRVTDPPMFMLTSMVTGNDQPPCGDDYMLATLDEEAPLTGTAPSLDAFAVHDVRWAREQIQKLADADLEALAEIDSRPGVQSAIASEVLRRAERAARESVPPGCNWTAPFGPGSVSPPGADPLEPADNRAAAAFPDDGEIHNPAIDGVRSIEISAAGLKVAEMAYAPSEPTDPNDPPVIWGGAGPALPTVGRCILPPHDGLEEVFGNLPSRPPPDLEDLPDRTSEALDAQRAEIGLPIAPDRDDELLAAQVTAEDALGPDYRWMRRARPLPSTEAVPSPGLEPHSWMVGVVHPTTPDAVRGVGGNTPAEAIANAQAWLASMRVPVEPRNKRKRRESALVDSPPSPEVSELTRRIAELEAANVGLATQLRVSDDELAALTADRDRLAAIVRADDTASDALSAEIQQGLAALTLARETADNAMDKLDVAEAERDHLRALLAEERPMPTTLSPEGLARAVKVQSALRALADAYPWTVAAEEARATLDAAGLRGLG